MATKQKVDVTEATESTEPGGDYSENGKIFKHLCDNLTRVSKASEDFVNQLGKAISKKIWLGFIHPTTGEICSFIHRDSEGNIDDSLSFKMWVASGKEKGGLGIDNFGLIENLLRGHQTIFNQVMPLLLDSGSLRQANQIRESQGQPPLIKLNKEKEFYLKKITTAPNPRFSELYQRGLPVKVIGQCANLYLKSNSKEQLEIDIQLDKIIKEKSDANITSKLAELFELQMNRSIYLCTTDPYISAKKLVDTLGNDKEFLESLLHNLQNLISDLQ